MREIGIFILHLIAAAACLLQVLANFLAFKKMRKIKRINEGTGKDKSLSGIKEAIIAYQKMILLYADAYKVISRAGAITLCLLIVIVSLVSYS